MLKGILFIAGIITIIVLFMLQNAFSKPVYNKMSNVWQDDEEGRQIAHFIIGAMVVIGFLLGILVS
jgi:cytochrome c biogenesis protein CcdA